MVTLAFDMDGTLFDSGELIEVSWKKAADEFRENSGITLKVPSAETILTKIGFPIEVIYSDLFPELTPGQQTEYSDLCVKYLCEDIAAGGGYVYEGIPEMLNVLKKHDFRMVIASNGDIKYLKTIISSKKIEQYFEDEIITIDRSKIANKNDIVSRYVQKYSDSTEFIMIGDRLSDLNAAKSNSIHFIGCSFGHAGDQEFKGEKYIAHSPAELLDAVRKITGVSL